MNILTEIFQNFSTFSKYAPGVETNMDLNDLQSSGVTARKRIESIVTPAVFAHLLRQPAESGLSEALRSAMANMTMASQIIFDSIVRRKNKVDVYKYELEAMKRAYMENYYNAMDTIIRLLMAAPTHDDGELSKAWEQSRYHSLMDACRLKSADEFDAIYPIDMSYLFFFRTLPLQKECMDERLSAYYERLTDDNRDRIEPSLNLALAKKTIAKSLRRFDVLEFPTTIRNLFDESHASRSGKDENEKAIRLASLLDGEVDALISDIDALLSTDTTIDVSSYSAYNNEKDKIVMLP